MRTRLENHRTVLSPEQQRGLARRRKQGWVVTATHTTPAGWDHAHLYHPQTGRTQHLFWRSKEQGWKPATY